MQGDPRLKPLFANLKRLKIGEYFNTKEFDLFILENDLDEMWEECKQIISRKKTVIMVGYHDTEDEEDAFMLFMSWYFEQENASFENFIFLILLNFANWHSTKLDYTGIIRNLIQIGIKKEKVEQFEKKFEYIQENKPSETKELKTNNNNKLNDGMIRSNKIFVVHGQDDKSRLELCKFLKDDFKLEPIVLKEKPNKSIETIISKFERLASECSAAIVLFTPDDDSGDNKRARQNVIFELGYFLGKFHQEDNRRVIILKKGNIEIPSDINGVLYLEYTKEVKELYYDLKKQLEYWGYLV
ncbi:MAG: TIR domain-containing protein [Ginsengibacter sp.]